MPNLPNVIQNFNVYTDGNRLVGITGEVSMPEINAVVAEVNGAGMLGSVSFPAIGHFENMEQQIPFASFNREFFDLTDFTSQKNLTLRGALQEYNPATGALEAKGLRIVMRGNLTGITSGTLKAGEGSAPSITLALTYILIAYDDQEVFELDKMNAVYKVNGRDILAEYTRLC